MEINLLQLSDRDDAQVDELTRITALLSPPPRKVILNFSNVTFMHPTVTLGLSALLIKWDIEFSITGIRKELEDYLNTVYFPQGIRPDFNSNWNALLIQASNKTYLPIVNFSTGKDSDSVEKRNNIISLFTQLLCEKYNFDSSIFGAISYFISEFTDNIIDHAGEQRGLLFYQFYPAKRFVEISIIDSGKTYLGAYKENPNFEHVKTDSDALKCALGGQSTKGGKERGFGVPTSIRLIDKGLRGKVIIASGESLSVNAGPVFKGRRWSGTILTIKIPENQEQIDIHDFIS